MIYFVKSEIAGKPKNEYVELIAYIQAAVLAIIALCQLFFLQDYLNIFANMGLGSQSQSYFMGAFIIWAEVFSIPFLLQMKLSKAFRVFCMLLLWVVTIFWIYLSLWLPFDGRDSGLLGGQVVVQSGLPLAAFAVIFGGLSMNNIWGLWPLDRKHSKRKKI
jgi:hypothetical protein